MEEIVNIINKDYTVICGRCSHTKRIEPNYLEILKDRFPQNIVQDLEYCGFKITEEVLKCLKCDKCGYKQARLVISDKFNRRNTSSNYKEGWSNTSETSSEERKKLEKISISRRFLRF